MKRREINATRRRNVLTIGEKVAGRPWVQGLGGLPADGPAGCQDHAVRLRATATNPSVYLRRTVTDGCILQTLQRALGDDRTVRLVRRWRMAGQLHGDGDGAGDPGRDG